MAVEDLKKNAVMAHLLDALDHKKDIGHYGRLVFTMVARHFLSEDEVVSELAKDKDFSEEQARSLFLQVQPKDYNPTKIVRTVKSITAREVFLRVPSVKSQLWGGAFWASGYDIKTVGRHGSEATIREYVAGQGGGQEYRRRPLDIPQLAAASFH